MTDIENVKKMVDEFRDKLSEHCDSVRIFVSFPSLNGESDTVGYTNGGGNLFAQHGQVREWLEFQREYARIEARKDVKE